MRTFPPVISIGDPVGIHPHVKNLTSLDPYYTYTVIISYW